MKRTVADVLQVEDMLLHCCSGLVSAMIGRYIYLLRDLRWETLASVITLYKMVSEKWFLRLIENKGGEGREWSLEIIVHFKEYPFKWQVSKRLSPVSLSLLHIHIPKFPSWLPSLPHVFPMNLVGEYLSVGLESTRSSDKRAQSQYYMAVKNLNFGPDYPDLNCTSIVTLVKLLTFLVSQLPHLWR